MANAGLGIVVALGIGIVASLALFLFRSSPPQTHEYGDSSRRDREYNYQNSWSQTTNRRNVRQKNRKQNDSASEKKESVCTICMSEETGEFISLHCGHEFHKLCIISWQKMAATCPMCRSNFHL